MTSRHARSTAGAVGAGAHRVAAGPLALAHDVPHAPGLGAGVADAHRAGHVGAVAVDDAPEVDDDQLAGLDPPAARAGVRLGRVGAGGDDRVEAVAARAAPAHLDLEVEREVALGRPVGQAWEQRAERVVGDRAGGADAGDLAGSLTRRTRSTSPSVGTSSWPSSTRGELALLGPGDRVGLEPDARRRTRARRRARRAGCATVAPISMRASTPAAPSCSPACVRYRPSDVNTIASAVTSSIAELPVKPVR